MGIIIITLEDIIISLYHPGIECVVWCLRSRYYRQSIVLSNVSFPEATSAWKRHCLNWAGKVLVPPPPSPGTVTSVFVTVSQSFHRLNVTSLAEESDIRFKFFTKKV
jgi:U3 small nucleolar RNA-associated protein 25